MRRERERERCRTQCFNTKSDVESIRNDFTSTAVGQKREKDTLGVTSGRSIALHNLESIISIAVGN